MEFNEKLQELRKQKGLTQEELAQKIFVSRTAVSKWESGRGYPSLDSLKEIARFFSITVDELLSNKELITALENDNKRKENCIRDLVFGLLDISIALFLFLPLFADRVDGIVYEVSLLGLKEIKLYLRLLYYGVVGLSVVLGVLTLAMQNFDCLFWQNIKRKISLTVNVLAVVLFVVSLQPYAAVLSFVFLIVKTFTLIKW
jgi:transcriptional regulator with XRE-family HTH domain